MERSKPDVFWDALTAFESFLYNVWVTPVYCTHVFWQGWDCVAAQPYVFTGCDFHTREESRFGSDGRPQLVLAASALKASHQPTLTLCALQCQFLINRRLCCSFDLIKVTTAGFYTHSADTLVCAARQSRGYFDSHVTHQCAAVFHKHVITARTRLSKNDTELTFGVSVGTARTKAKQSRRASLPGSAT